MYKPPSSRKRRRQNESRLNLTPILDAVFIFIFFLLMSANFFQVYQIQSDVPIVSDQPPPKTKPLALTVEIRENELVVLTGVPSSIRKRFSKLKDGEYDYNSLHEYCLQLKKQYKQERTAIIEPKVNVVYEKIVKIMDAVRILRSTDDAIYIKDKQGIDVETRLLFDKIIFANIF